MEKTKILIYDSISTGHHLDYLFYLIHQASQRTHVELILVCSEKIKKNLNDFSFPIEQFPHISFDFLSESSIETLHRKQILFRSVNEWNLAVSFAHKHQANQLLFPFFDYFQLGALIGSRPKVKVSGILFRGKVANKGYAFVKKTVLKLVLSKHFFDKLFVLSEDFMENVKKTTGSNKIVYLPDPVFQFPDISVAKNTLIKKLSIDSQKIVFLNFGYLDDRKGIIEFLEACKLLPTEQQQCIHLILAGKIAPNLLPKVQQLIEELPHISISPLFAYHLPEESQALFEISDWTLVLYPKFLGSSSVLIRSAMANKPVLGNNIGTIGHQIKEHSLGIAIDPSNRAAIAEALKDILYGKTRVQAQGIADFSAKHSIQNFGKILFPSPSRASGDDPS